MSASVSSLSGLGCACGSRALQSLAVRHPRRIAPGARGASGPPAMLGTLMTALFFVVRAFGQVSPRWPGSR